MQPFKMGMIVNKKDFCGRKNEIKYLKEHLLSNDRVYIYGERRTGKTSLVYETVSQIRNRKCLSIDLLGIKSSDDLCKRMIRSIVSFHHKNTNFLEKVLKQFSTLGPTISIDPVTNMPTIGLSQVESLTHDNLESILDIIDESKDTIIFFDEFQDILKIKEYSQILAVMRSRFQKMICMSFIFAGSIRNTMMDIFTLDSSPFYKYAYPLLLGPIEEDIFINHLRNRFMTGKREIENELLRKIIKLCGEVPGDIQRFCAALWEISSYGDKIVTGMFTKAFDMIFSLEMPIYERILHDVSSQQIKCLVALSKLGGESSLSKQLIEETGITLAGSVNKALNSLVEKRVLQKQDNRYKFCNPFFKSWLLVKNI